MIEKIIASEKPSILKNRILIEKTKTEKEIAEKEFYPDFNFTLQYSQRDEIESTGKQLDDFLSFRLGFNLPLNYGGKRSARVEEAELRQKLFDEQIESITLNTVAAATKKFESLESIERRIRLLEQSLLPQSEVNSSAALSGLGTGLNDYLSVIDAFEKIIEIKFRYLDLKHNYLAGKTNLEYILGTELNGVSNE